MDVRKLFLALCLVSVVPALSGCPAFPSGSSAPPEIVLLIPGAGSMTGGTSIQISGKNFVDVVSVTIGGQELLERSVVDRNVIKGKTPPGVVGANDVVVTTAHGSTTRSAAYNYTSIFPVTFGTTSGALSFGRDIASAGIAADSSGNMYVAGSTDKSFPGFINQGGEDLFVLKMDNNGALLWVQQLGTDGGDAPEGMGTDSKGNVYVVVSTSRSFPGTPAPRDTDLHVLKFDKMGARQWIQQVGTSRRDYARAMVTDGSGNVYVAGTTEGSFPGFTNAGSQDVFVTKLNSDGVVQWTQQRGDSSEDTVTALATDGAGHVYLTGEVGRYNVGGYFLKLDGTGAEVFNKLLGADTSYGRLVTDHAGAVYASGAGKAESQVSKLDENGAPRWTQPLGLAASSVTGLAPDSSGNVYVVGETRSYFPGFKSFGQLDTFVMKLDGTTGARQWVQQVGGFDNDRPSGAVIDGKGNVFVSGSSGSVFPGRDNLYNNTDVFVMKFKPTGEMF